MLVILSYISLAINYWRDSPHVFPRNTVVNSTPLKGVYTSMAALSVCCKHSSYLIYSRNLLILGKITLNPTPPPIRKSTMSSKYNEKTTLSSITSLPPSSMQPIGTKSRTTSKTYKGFPHFYGSHPLVWCKFAAPNWTTRIWQEAAHVLSQITAASQLLLDELDWFRK